MSRRLVAGRHDRGDGVLAFVWADGAERELEDSRIADDLVWALASMDRALERLRSNTYEVELAWASACETVWWASVIDDLLFQQAPLYKVLRDEVGQEARAMRWVRHRITHSFRLAASEPHEENYYGGEGATGGYPLVRSSGMYWLKPDEIVDPAKAATSTEERNAYSANFARRSVELTLLGLRDWLQTVLETYGVRVD